MMKEPFVPSSLAHGLAGVALAGFAQHFRGRTASLLPRGNCNRARFFVLAGALACAASAPDLDFVPGVLLGDPDWLHRGRSHSLLAATMVGMVVYAVGRMARREAAAPFAILMGLAYASHVFLDMFSPDPVRFNGVPAFWPLSNQHFVVPASVFLPIRRDPASAGFLASLWSLHNGYAVLREAAIMGVVVILAGIRGRSSAAAGSQATSRPLLNRRVDSES
jgi:membrane-bound metal-dependent hydrolase YbcI (DUF457 family)